MPVTARDRAVRPRRLQRGTPPGEPAGHRQRRDGVTEIVLAVAERPLAVFPRFAPMNRRQRDEQDVRSAAERALPRAFVEQAAQFERVTIRGVVIDRRLISQSMQRAANDIRLGRVEVAAGRIDSERPPRRLEMLPRREPQRMPQHVANGGGADGLSRRLELTGLIEGRVTR